METVIEWIIRRILQGLLVLVVSLNFSTSAGTLDEELAKYDNDPNAEVINVDEWELNEDVPPTAEKATQTPEVKKGVCNESGN